MVRKKYLTHSSFFEYKPKQKDSHIWRKILEQREILRKGIRWKIGNGQHINFWLDNWAFHNNLLDTLHKSPHEVDLNLTLQDVILPSKKWDITKLSSLVPTHIIRIIQALHIPSSDIKDTPIWGYSTNGLFTVKSANWIAHNISIDTPKWPFRWLWAIEVPPKLKIFLWQICHKSLGVRHLLHARNIISFNDCPICSRDTETLDHLFLTCDLINDRWALPLVKQWLD